MLFPVWLNKSNGNGNSLPFIALYTKLRAGKVNASTWYGTRLVYTYKSGTILPENNLTTNTTPYQFCINGKASTPNIGYNQVLLTVEDNKTAGVTDDDDEVQFIAISTNSVSPAGTINFVIPYFIYFLTEGIHKNNLLSGPLSHNAEKIRAIGIENALRRDLNNTAAQLANLLNSLYPTASPQASVVNIEDKSYVVPYTPPV
jgi:hypothetical protein